MNEQPPLSPLRMGIAGLGRMGMFHLERLSMIDECRLVAAFDVDPSRQAVAEGLGCPAVQEWQQLLDHPVELLLIATPPHTHAALVTEALRAGKHVAVEKPLCLTVSEADAICEAAERYDRRVVVMQNRRCEDDDFLTALTTARSGTLGRLTAVKFIVWEYGRPPQEPPNARDSHRARCPVGSDWRGNRRHGGGVLFEFGAHYFDQLLHLVARPVESVFAQIPEAGPLGNRAFLAIVTFQDGVTAHVEVNLASPARLHTGWVLTGTSGGYRNFRQSYVTDEGEVYSSAVEAVATDWTACYHALASRVRSAASTNDGLAVSADEGLSDLHQARRVVALLEELANCAR